MEDGVLQFFFKFRSNFVRFYKNPEMKLYTVLQKNQNGL